MSRLSTATPALISAIVGGCTFGTAVRDFQPAWTPNGVMVDAKLRHGSVRGELLAVRADGFLVRCLRCELPTSTNPALSGLSIALIAYPEFKRAGFDQTGIVLRGQRPIGAEHERLRLLSRYPQGVGNLLMERLLSAHGQADLVRVGT